MAIKKKYIKGEHLEPKSSSNMYYIENCPTDLNVHKILRDLYLHRGYVVNPETWDSNQSAGINHEVFYVRLGQLGNSQYSTY